MTVEKSTIAGLLVVRGETIRDERGFFRQSYQAGELADALGHEPVLRQGNHSRSAAGVLRGFHREPWSKLIYIVHGNALCVVADVRPQSPTFGRSESFLLGDPPGDHMRLFVSEGLANAFYCYTETDYINDVSKEFDPHDRGGVIWNDPVLAVDWPDPSPLLSQTDVGLPRLEDLYPDHPVVRARVRRE